MSEVVAAINDALGGAPGAACGIAKLEHKQALRWVSLWNVLLYAVGIVVTLILITLLGWSIYDSKWAAAAATGVGAILELPLGRFLVKRRKEAREALADARTFVTQACADSTAGGAAGYLDEVERGFRFLGRL